MNGDVTAGVLVNTTAMMPFEVDTALYPIEAIFRACYKFTDRCYLLLRRRDEVTLVIEFRKRQTTDDLCDIIGAFGNELIDQRIRVDLARETRTTRDLIVAQAFIEANLGETSDDCAG